MGSRICSVDKCKRPNNSNGFCSAHLERWQKGQDLLLPIKQRNVQICSVDWCQDEHFCKGYCSRHDKQIRTKGEILPQSPVRVLYDPQIKQSFADHQWEEFIALIKNNCVVDSRDCWNWSGTLNSTGYARMTLTVDGVTERYLYRSVLRAKLGHELTREPVHHKCANRACCNPDHLQQVSQRENVAEMLERNYYISRIAELEAENIVLRAALKETRSDYFA